MSVEVVGWLQTLAASVACQPEASHWCHWAYRLCCMWLAVLCLFAFWTFPDLILMITTALQVVCSEDDMYMGPRKFYVVKMGPTLALYTHQYNQSKMLTLTYF